MNLNHFAMGRYLLPIGFLFIFSCTETIEQHGAGENWAYYLGGPNSSQYSSLTQINKNNISQLEIAWMHDTEDSAMYQANNLVVDGIVYTPTPERRVHALNGVTGELIWKFEPMKVKKIGRRKTQQRGLLYWKSGQDSRIYTSYGPWLFAIDASSGQLVSSFGTDGALHLGEQMDVEGQPNVTLNVPGYVYRDLLIMGGNVGEDMPGAIRALDIKTGERQWIFHTLPRPGEEGSETWPANYLERTGGASDWSGIAIDTVRGIVYSSTETAGPDFYGGDRYGENLFANSLIALDANTGKRIWHHQLVHHDMWDLDCPSPPNLLTVQHEGRAVDVVAQGTKMGLLFVFNRETGEPLWPIEERPTPQSKIPEIKTWPTQPFPTKPPPLTRQKYSEEDLSNISPRAELLTKEMLAQFGAYGSYPPPTLDQTIIFPGFDGGMEWGGAAADLDGMLYVNVNEIPWYYQLMPTRKEDGSPLPLGERQYRIKCASCHGMDRSGDPGSGFPSLNNIAQRHTRETTMQFIVNGGGRMPAFDRVSESTRNAIVSYLFGSESSTENSNPEEDSDLPPFAFMGFERWFDEEGYPAIKPPWGTLNAVDLNTGTVKWKVPLGEYPELTKRGVPQTGTENYGGPIVTASDLIFIGGSADAKFRAFDKETGSMLWEHDLPFDGNSTPSTYMANGKQYIIISAGGAKTNRPKGGMLVAFALP